MRNIITLDVLSAVSENTFTLDELPSQTEFHNFLKGQPVLGMQQVWL
jgi:hypothetical protein